MSKHVRARTRPQEVADLSDEAVLAELRALAERAVAVEEELADVFGRFRVLDVDVEEHRRSDVWDALEPGEEPDDDLIGACSAVYGSARRIGAMVARLGDRDAPVGGSGPLLDPVAGPTASPGVPGVSERLDAMRDRVRALSASVEALERRRGGG